MHGVCIYIYTYDVYIYIYIIYIYIYIERERDKEWIRRPWITCSLIVMSKYLSISYTYYTSSNNIYIYITIIIYEKRHYIRK